MPYRFFLNDHTTIFRSDKPPYNDLEFLNLRTGRWADLGHKAQHYENLGEVPREEIVRAIQTWGETGIRYTLEPGGPTIEL